MLTGASQLIIIIIPGPQAWKQSYTITAPLWSIHPLLPLRRWWSYSTIQYPSLPDQVAHVGKVARIRPQETAVSWAWTPTIHITVQHSAAGLPIPIVIRNLGDGVSQPGTTVSWGQYGTYIGLQQSKKTQKQSSFQNMEGYGVHILYCVHYVLVIINHLYSAMYLKTITSAS